MPDRKTAKPYRWLAQYYDEFFQPLRPPIDNARRRLLRKILPNVTSACDLACGSGTTALELAANGSKVYAVDLSPDMCRITRQKAGAMNLPVKVIRSDMRTFRLPTPVDLIVSECDAVNHIARKADLRLVAQSVSKALNQGGYFFFDVNNALGFIRYWTGTYFVEQPGVIMIMNNGHTRKADRAWSEVDWFILDDNSPNTWRRHQEHVDEVCWSEEEIARTFDRAGMDLAESWDSTPFFKNDSLVSPGCRTFYLMRKR